MDIRIELPIDHDSPRNYFDELHLQVTRKIGKLILGHFTRHEDPEGSGGIAPSFLTSALDGAELSAPRSSAVPIV
jgi:hypothetical protein